MSQALEVDTPSQPLAWPSRVAQISTFFVAVAGIAFLGFLHPNAPVLAEVLTFCLAIIVLLRLPGIAKLKALGFEVETRAAVSRLIDRQVASRSERTPAQLPEATRPAAAAKDKAPQAPTPLPTDADHWSQGHTYWLGNNIMFAAFALAQGNVSAALLEWNHAIGHAQRLPLDPKYAARLRELQDCDLLNPHQRVGAIQGLIQTAAQIGQLVAARDQRFDDWEFVRGGASPAERPKGG